MVTVTSSSSDGGMACESAPPKAVAVRVALRSFIVAGLVGFGVGFDDSIKLEASYLNGSKVEYKAREVELQMSDRTIRYPNAANPTNRQVTNAMERS